MTAIRLMSAALLALAMVSATLADPRPPARIMPLGPLPRPGEMSGPEWTLQGVWKARCRRNGVAGIASFTIGADNKIRFVFRDMTGKVVEKATWKFQMTNGKKFTLNVTTATRTVAKPCEWLGEDRFLMQASPRPITFYRTSSFA